MPMLHAGGHHEMLNTIQRFEVELGTESSLNDGERHVGDKIVLFAAPLLVRGDTQVHVEVARLAATRADRTATSESKRLARVDTGRHFESERHFFHDTTFAAACSAR